MSDARVHHSTLKYALPNGVLDSAKRSNLIDRPQMMLVTGVGCLLAVKRYAKRGAVKRKFDVVRRKSVPGEK
jgi:hypothetical protein